MCRRGGVPGPCGAGSVSPDARPARPHRNSRRMWFTAKVVGDKQVGKAQPALQVLQQVHDLCLHKDIERRYPYELGPQHESGR